MLLLKNSVGRNNEQVK